MGFLAYLIEGSEKNPAKILWIFKKAIMRCVLPSVIPNPLGGIQLGPIPGQLENLQVAPVFGEILIGFLLLMIRGIVLDEINSMAPPIKRRH